MFNFIFLRQLIINLFIPFIFEILNLVIFENPFNITYLYYGLSSYFIYIINNKTMYKRLGFILFFSHLVLFFFFKLFYLKYKVYSLALFWCILLLLSLLGNIYFWNKVNKKSCIFLYLILIEIFIYIIKISKLL